MSDIEAHRLPVTVLGGCLAFTFVAGSIALLIQTNTFIAKRKSSQYMVLATVGLLFYIRDTLDIAWNYPAYNDYEYETFLYYLIAVPIHFLPVMIRSWRIFCVYRPTPNWHFQMDSLAVRKRRSHLWMVTRMFFIYLPFAFVALGLYWDPSIPYFTYVALNGVYAITNLVMTYKLYTMRLELRPKFLDETKALLSYSVVALVEWIWTNVIYLYAYVGGVDGPLVPYMYIDLFLVALMWGLTVGKVLFRVWKKRKLEGDQKPQLTDAAIKIARDKVNVEHRSLSMSSEISGSEEGSSDVSLKKEENK